MSKLESAIRFAAIFLVICVMLLSPVLAFEGGELEPASVDLELAAQLLEGMDTAEAAGELRGLLDITRLMSDTQLRDWILGLASEYGYTLTDGEIDSVVALCRSLEPLTEAELRIKLEHLRAGVQAVREAEAEVNGLGQQLRELVNWIGDLFRSTFGAAVFEG